MTRRRLSGSGGWETEGRLCRRTPSGKLRAGSVRGGSKEASVRERDSQGRRVVEERCPSTRKPKNNLLDKGRELRASHSSVPASCCCVVAGRSGCRTIPAAVEGDGSRQQEGQEADCRLCKRRVRLVDVLQGGRMPTSRCCVDRLTLCACRCRSSQPSRTSSVSVLRRVSRSARVPKPSKPEPTRRARAREDEEDATVNKGFGSMHGS